MCIRDRVEDEEQLRKIIKMNLEMEGFEVIATDNGRIALELTDQQHFDLMILDVMPVSYTHLDVYKRQV